MRCTKAAVVHTFAVNVSLQLERGGICVEECSLPVKSALSFTVVAFREISSTAAALIKLLLPIEIHVVVCELQAMHRPTIAGLLLQGVRHSSIVDTWCVVQWRYTGRRPLRCSSWFLKTVFKITFNISNIRQSQLLC